jgi:ADP-ribosyl-[dinitrogen reductase] hydrolase
MERFMAATRPSLSVFADRAIGSLVGLAVGDAVGAAVEFQGPGTFEPISDMIGGGPFNLKPGEWTDDTSMALCLAESLIERKGFDAKDQLQRYVRWWKGGHYSAKGYCFDIGNQTSTALAEFVATGKPFCGPIGDDNSGNGSLMRLCPAVIPFCDDPEEAIAAAGESSRTTHGSRQCVDACRYFGALLVGAMNGVPKRALLQGVYSPMSGCWESRPLDAKIVEVAAGSFRAKEPPEIRGTGYVVDCLEAALWAFDRTDTFKEAILSAANLGDDADTTAAVCGQIAGAYYGYSQIPENWRKLAMIDVIERLAKALVELRGTRQKR